MKIFGNKFKLVKVFKDESSKFLLVCGIKFSSIYLFSAIFIYYIMWIILSLNNIYFESKGIGFDIELREAFIQNILGAFYKLFPEIFIFLIVLFFAGAYVGKVLLRPFELIGQYCLEKTQGQDVHYRPDIFSDYKVLTRFSEFFFRYVESALTHKELTPNTIPEEYRRIRTPKFEKDFFLHFFILITIIGTITGLFLFYINTEIESSLMDLSLRMISAKDPTVGYFIQNQSFIFDSIVVASSFIILVSYTVLSFHLYSKVSGAIFAFFATMRAFMKGNFQARVHLIGYSHIRSDGRKFNKYLDYVERQCKVNHNKLN